MELNSTISFGLKPKKDDFWGFAGPAQYRYIVSFSTENGDCIWYASDITRPSMVMENVIQPVGYQNTYIPSRYKWDDITINFKDAVGPNSNELLMEWVRTYAESVTGRMGFAANYKRDISIEKLAPTGIVVEKWRCYGTCIKSIVFNDLAFQNSEMHDVQCTISIDSVVLVF